ncbi:MAG: protein kinase [Planctomycetes bacterium]|nr:protein kinase [Planctomycetota bacterium]
MSEEDLLKPGETVGSYKVVARIGRGGMGEVYRADDPSLERSVALKVMSASLAQDRTYADRFRTEARSAASLVHPNVVNVFGFGEVRGLPYIAMEFIDGESLQQKLVREKKIGLRQAVVWMTEAARGLEAAAKRGVVHRDIKPHNLLIDREGQLKIADFGLAKKVDREVALTQAGVALGTPLYMSPEQGRGDPVDWRSDTYSLGATFYHAIAGKAPFEADSALAVLTKHATAALTPLNSVRTDVPPALSAIFSKMLSKAASDRHASHGALVADLERVLTSLPRSVGPSTAAVPGGVDAEDAELGRVAVKRGLIKEPQLNGAIALQEKMKASGKPVRRLDEILVAAKLITPEQALVLKEEGVQRRLAAQEDEPDDRGPSNLEITDAGGAALPAPGKGPVCPLCRLGVRPDQVQMNCPECGMTQHSECMTSYGGCGNEKCSKSPKSMAMAAMQPAQSGRAEPRESSAAAGTIRRLILRVGAVAVVGVIAMLVWKSLQKSPQDLFDEAKNLDAGGKKGRLSIFSIDETAKEVSAGSGLSGEALRRLETQVSLYRRALEKDPAFLPARVELAACLILLRRKPEALKEYEAILATNPGNKESLLGAGSILFQNADYEHAEPYLLKAAEAGESEAWMTLAILYQDKKNEPLKAVGPLKKYVADKGDDGNGWSRLAIAQFDSGDDVGAVASAEKAIQKGTTNSGAYLVRARIAFKGGKYEEAASSAMESAEKTWTGNTSQLLEARKLAGKALAKAGRPQLAREQLNMAKGVNPDDVEVLVALGELGRAAGDWNDAGANFKAAYEHGSGNPDHMFQAGYLFYQGHTAGQAAASFEALHRKQADYKDLNLWLARAYLMSGSLENASPAVKRALEERPDDPDRQALRVWELGIKVNLDEAIRFGKECLAKSPGNAELNYRLAFVYERVRDYDKQRESMLAAADAGLLDAIYECGEICQRFRDIPNALKYFKLYLEKMPVGFLADQARGYVMGLTSAAGNGTPGPNPTPDWKPAPSMGWEFEVKEGLEVLGQAPKTTEEPGDRAYFGVMACIVCCTRTFAPISSPPRTPGNSPRSGRRASNCASPPSAAPATASSARSRRPRRS